MMNSTRRRILVRAATIVAAGAACAAATLLGPVAPAQAALAGADATLIRAPYLTDVTQTSVQVSWMTTTQSRQTVRWGTAGGSCATNSATSATLGQPYTVVAVKGYQNSVKLTGLTAGNSYCYRIFTGASTPVDLLGSLPSPSFGTLSAVGSAAPYTFAVMGDGGSTLNNGVDDGSVNQDQANVMSQISNSGVKFLMTVGDLTHPNSDQKAYGDLNQTGASTSAVFGPSYWAGPGQKIPLFATYGNHGRNSTQETIWPEDATASASDGQYTMATQSALGSSPVSSPSAYYAFTAGNARFYVLDSAWTDGNTGSATGGACGSDCVQYEVDAAAHWAQNSAEYTWLQADLAAHPGGLKFAFFHFPLRSDVATEPSNPYTRYTPGSSGTLEQLLSQGGVNLVFNGHAHAYQRYIAPPGGVNSYVTGGGGAKLTVVSKCKNADAYAVGWSYSSTKGSACGAATPPSSRAMAFHFLKVAVSGTSVTVTPVDSLGQTFDPVAYDFGPDTTAPSAPGSVTATQTSSTKVTLQWTAATDAVGVLAYDVYRNGAYLDTLRPGLLSYLDSTATSGATYTYRIAARDLAGNVTGVDVSNGTTLDSQPPTAPGAPVAGTVTSASVPLSWAASTDNVGVTRYDVLRGGAVVGTSTTASFTDATVAAGSTYSYAIRAADAAGNLTTGTATSVTTPGGGSPAVFADGFETGVLGPAWSTQSGLAVTSSQPVHSGTFAARATGTNAAHYAYATVPAATEYWASAWVYPVSHSTSANLFGFRKSSGSIVNVYLDSGNRLALRNNIGGVTTYSTATVANGGWHLVTLHAIVNGAGSSVDVTLDGVPAPNLTLTGQDLGTSAIARLQVGETATDRTYDFVFDDVKVTVAP